MNTERQIDMSELTVVELSGSFRDMGRAFGEMFRQDIDRFADTRLQLTLSKCRNNLPAADMLFLARQFVEFQSRALPYVHEEFMGIAEGAGISPSKLMIGNAYTDFADSAQACFPLQGCTAFLARKRACKQGVLAAQTWDMSSSAEEFVVLVKRTPNQGPRTISLTTKVKAGVLS